MEQLSVEERLREPDRCQENWYRLVSRWVAGRKVLDVGAGSGYGLDILRAARAHANGIDPLPLRNDISAVSIEDMASHQFDVVVACDVIEHIQDDADFLLHLVRVAREFVFLSTPRFKPERPINPYHVREYTPDELEQLLHRVHKGYRPLFFADRHHDAPVRVASAAEVVDNFGVLLQVHGAPMEQEIPIAALPTATEDDRWRCVRYQMPPALAGFHVLDVPGKAESWGLRCAREGALVTIVQPDSELRAALEEQRRQSFPEVAERVRVLSHHVSPTTRIDVALITACCLISSTAPPYRWPRSSYPGDPAVSPALAVALEDALDGTVIIPSPPQHNDTLVSVLCRVGFSNVCLHPGECEDRPILVARRT